jgi:hypothetical protein
MLSISFKVYKTLTPPSSIHGHMVSSGMKTDDGEQDSAFLMANFGFCVLI